MKSRTVIIVFIIFTILQFSSIIVAGEVKFSDPYIQRVYSEEELLLTINNYPLNYRSHDKLSTFHHPTRAVALMASPDALTLWKIDGRKVDTGQIEALMNAECVSSNGKMFSWFYWRDYSVLKTHLGEKFPKDYPKIIDKIHKYDKNNIKSKVIDLLNIAKITRNKPTLICAQLE